MSKMKKRYYSEFKSKKLENFLDTIWGKSIKLMNEIIEKRSPIQKGEIVFARTWAEPVKVKVTMIDLMISGKYEPYSGKYSFRYFGIPVRKDGVTPMRNRNEIEFNGFTKNGKKYDYSSGYRLKVVPATMHEFICGKCDRR